MPIFTYTALTKAGVAVSGECAAVDEAQLTLELAQRELRPQSIQQKRRGVKLQWRRRVTPEAFALFNQEFIALVRAGLTIPDALKLCAVNELKGPGGFYPVPTDG